VVCLAPRAPGDSVRPRRPAGASGRPLNFTVRRMSTGTHRAVELLVGFGLVGYCAYAIYTGSILGRFSSYGRTERPWSFWASVLFTFGIGLVFLFGAVSWRN
jgi:hypothetical protein